MSLAAAAALALTSHIRFALTAVTIAGTTVATTFRAKSATVVTLTTASAHGLFVGASVVVSGVGGALAASYNGTVTVLSVPTTTTFTYAEVTDTASESSTADTGGSVVQSGTVSSSIKPMATASNWLNLGDVEDSPEYDPRAEANMERIIAIQGQLASDVDLPPFAKPMIKFKLNQLIDQTVALSLAGDPVTSGATQFNPQSGVGAFKGWLKTMHLDNTDTLRACGDFWGVLRMSSPLKMDARDFIKPELEFSIARNALNTVYVV